MGVIQLKYGSQSATPSSLLDGEFAINLDTNQMWYGSGSTVLSDIRFDKITAETYVISSSVTHMTTSFSSGSTAFGDSVDDEHTFTGDILASGIVSSSKGIYASNYRVDGMHALDTSDSAATLNVGPAAECTKIILGKATATNLSIFTGGNITSSQNISASGTITGLTGSFNQLSVLSSGDTGTPPLEGHLLRITDTTNGNPDIEHFFAENDALTYGMRWHYDGGDNDLSLYRHDNSSTGDRVIKFNRGDSDTTFYGDVNLDSTNILKCNGVYAAQSDGTSLTLGQSNRPMQLATTAAVVTGNLSSSGDLGVEGNFILGDQVGTGATADNVLHINSAETASIKLQSLNTYWEIQAGKNYLGGDLVVSSGGTERARFSNTATDPFNSNKFIYVTNHNFSLDSTSTATDYFFPINYIIDSGTTSTYYLRWLAPYDGVVKKIILRPEYADMGSSCTLYFWKNGNGVNTFSSATDTVTGIDLSATNTSVTVNLASGNDSFSAGDILGFSIKKSSTTSAANMVACIVYELEK